MVCHAIGRCRICARKHRLPIFGSEQIQHALIEKVKLQLIILNTVCVDCIEKFERAIKEKDPPMDYTSSVCHSEITENYQSRDGSTTAQYAPIDATPTMHFYVESNNATTEESSSSCKNERLLPQDDCSFPEKISVTHQPKKWQSTDIPLTNSSPNRNKENVEISTKPRANKQRVPCRLCCDFCEKEFTHRGDLKRHKRKHTGEKPYECAECKKKFSQLSNLSRHRLVHSGERPFACAQCGQSYSRKGRLANHIGRQLCRRKLRIPTRLPQTWKE